MKTLDVSRYRIEPPIPSKQNDIKEWENAINNVKSQIEHQQSRLINLELLEKYGPDAWSSVNEDYESYYKYLNSYLNKVQNEINEVNKKRKMHQVDNENKLNTLNTEWFNLIESNLNTENAIKQTELQIKKKQKTL